MHKGNNLSKKQPLKSKKAFNLLKVFLLNEKSFLLQIKNELVKRTMLRKAIYQAYQKKSQKLGIKNTP